MMKAFVGLVLLSLLSLGLATPTISARGACATKSVTYMRQIFEVQPDTLGNQDMMYSDRVGGGGYGVFQTQVNQTWINGEVHLHSPMPAIINFQIPAGATRCQLALSDSMGTRDFQTPFFQQPPTMNIVSLHPNSLHQDNWTYNAVYNTPNVIKNPNFVNKFDLAAWEGELSVWDFQCPAPIGDHGDAFFVVELNRQSSGGDGIWGFKTWQVLETVPGQLTPNDEKYDVYNGFHILIDC
ncbi:hypothetical protein HYALB_00006716 [Hymenoscyphus albidus]|uniref:Ubiquitin 3 binding protein But2 C-terminal domain-containing protein n=1 Tax=Hymenoscyphus albidus TaxID=595503 RepID=A0A9N9LL49_9HELO|nr:hypothetical protein HYALB_00006716 [Hymenoscyphus albidus]